MIKAYKALASVSGIGYIKGGGTIASVLACVLWYYAALGISMQLLLVGLVCIIGVHAGNKVERAWGKDSPKVVIDEVAGMFITLVMVPTTLYTVVTGLILFRLFDILKPLYIRRAESLKGGWGVMLDDIIAAIYANIVLHAVIYFKLIGS